MKGLVGLALLLALAACGSETDGPEPRADTAVATPTAMPTEIPSAPGQVRTVFATTVIDDGDGAELCLGGVDDSLPPQCRGPKLVGWDWSQHEGDYEESGGTRWGDFGVTGTFDGSDFRPTEAVPADEFEEAPYDDPYDVDFTTPCEEPTGGWPEPTAEQNSIEATDVAFRLARRLPDYAGSWIDTSRDPRTPEQMDQDAYEEQDDVSSWIVNVMVTESVSEAEAAIREVWSGAVCVSLAEHTERELRQVQGEIGELPGMLGYGISMNRVVGDVTYDDGSMQAWLDSEYGADVVHLSPVLVDVG